MKKVLAKLTEQQKRVWLFALLKMDELVDKWSIVISAPWTDNEQNQEKDYENIIILLKETLSAEELSSIARISFMKKDDHLIEELLKRKSGEEVKAEPINGNVVHEGYILESNPNLNVGDSLFTRTQ